ncbi:MAG: hypothetical protein ABIT20_11825 [Gemmatimonadaceae bacterium]
MPHLALPEIVPGVVTRLDTQLLRSTGGSETNAQITDAEDRAVADERDFLVVAVNMNGGMCTAVPLFPKSSPGSAPLAADKRQGDVGGWLADDVHYSRWQHWRIPLSALSIASNNDPGDVGNRRSYALGDADTLQDLANWATRNRCAFRGV